MVSMLKIVWDNTGSPLLCASLLIAGILICFFNAMNIIRWAISVKTTITIIITYELLNSVPFSPKIIFCCLGRKFLRLLIFIITLNHYILKWNIWCYHHNLLLYVLSKLFLYSISETFNFCLYPISSASLPFT